MKANNNSEPREKKAKQLVVVAVLMAVMTIAVAAFVSIPSADAAGHDNYFYVYSDESTQWLGETNKYDDLQEAIDAAAASSYSQAYVLVAIGVYEATSSSPFSLADHVTVIGGFLGTESGITPTNMQDGDPDGTKNTVFTIGTSSNVFNNSGIGDTSVLTNAVIKGGNVCLNNNNSSPTITNCTFTQGTGINNNDSNAIIMNCSFEYCAIGISNNNNSSATIVGCTFDNNTNGGTNSGGGIANSNSNPTILFCSFTNNTAYNGGGIANSNSNSTIMNCSFTNNAATRNGGGVYNFNSSTTIANCEFISNWTTTGGSGYNGGGAVHNSTSGGMITNCLFRDNTSSNAGANAGGGAMYNDHSIPTITNCVFENNKNDSTGGFRGGGAMYNYSSSPVITNSSFVGNKAMEASFTSGGGGIFNNSECSPVITNCVFEGNEAYSGGGILNSSGSSAKLTGCTFLENKAVYGGGECNLSSGGAVTNCTFIYNTATGNGNGMYNGPVGSPTNTAGSSPRIVNCLFALNSNNTPSSTIYNGGNGTTPTNPYIVASVVGTSWYDSSATGNATAQTPVAADFGLDGSLKSTATYAFKNGSIPFYSTALTSVLPYINADYGLSLTMADMRDIKGDLVVDSNDKIDVGAFRYIDTGETDDEFVEPALPDPLVYAYSNGREYISGMLTNAPVDIYASLDDISNIAGFPFLPLNYVVGDLGIFVTDYNTSLTSNYSAPMHVTSNNSFDFYSASASVMSSVIYLDVLIDMTEPVVSIVSPSGASVALTANAIGITFSEDMDMGEIGTVTCDNGVTLAYSGWLFSDTVVYDITSGNLTPNTTFTISVSGFRDVAGNYMATDSSHDFTTVKASPTLTLTASPAGGQTYPGDITLTATLSGAYPNNSGKTISFTMNSALYGALPTNASGEVAISILNPDAASYDFGASFGGDTYNNSVSATDITGYVLSKVSPTLTLTASPAGGQTYPGDITVTATLSGAYPNNSGMTISFTMNGAAYSALPTNASGEVAISILNPDAASYDFGASYGGDAYNNSASATDITGYVLSKATLLEGDFDFSPLSEKYDGTPKAVTISTDITGIGAITVYYNGSTTVPTDAGDYLITIDVAEIPIGSNYNAAFGLSLGTFTITKNDSVKSYYITAAASPGATISPKGQMVVQRGNNITFSFSASSVTVDGKQLSKEEIALGYYTFTNVIMNHNISASGAPVRTPTVEVTITQKGSGYAEYSVNGSPFIKYTSPVTVESGSSVALKAVAGDGDEFKEWKSGNTVYTTAEISFATVTSSLHLDLSFTGDNGGIPLWVIGAVVLLVILIAVIAILLMRKNKA